MNTKKYCTMFWYRNFYTVEQMRKISKEGGGVKCYSFEEFYEMTGITVDEYDANPKLFADMKYEDIKKWVEENKVQ